MKELLNHILENILPESEKFEIEEDIEDGVVYYKVHLSPDSMGRVIGKGGKTINSIKNLLKINAIKEQKRVELEVVEAN